MRRCLASAVIAGSFLFLLGLHLGIERRDRDRMSADEWRRAYFVLADIAIEQQRRA